MRALKHRYVRASGAAVRCGSWRGRKCLGPAPNICGPQRDAIRPAGSSSSRAEAVRALPMALSPRNRVPGDRRRYRRAHFLPQVSGLPSIAREQGGAGLAASLSEEVRSPSGSSPTIVGVACWQKSTCEGRIE
jgi:hypothetical protein